VVRIIILAFRQAIETKRFAEIIPIKRGNDSKTSKFTEVAAIERKEERNKKQKGVSHLTQKKGLLLLCPLFLKINKYALRCSR
jgi:hypothetical protein